MKTLSKIAQFMRHLSPRYRRTQAKRHLETLLREHGLPKVTVNAISWKFFNNERPTL
ncbi:hypothetical protein BLL52_3761 [Rhodoferax antarcticus ANT.BR]|uniref:Uncharacterized protein n=1 Tax=Rhodoferax antarcticus ANT.BR TaxID=1111071 RepID=A0A1Q8YA58_9BURK|nr:hypothetical protein BLL52_3761 [Rhodoferax antarcticus ANT.BR]